MHKWLTLEYGSKHFFKRINAKNTHFFKGKFKINGGKVSNNTEREDLTKKHP